MITPVPWLERNPTYKDQIKELVGKDLSTYGFLGYPVLQAADITIYKANKVPVGVDQAPHVELTREIVRRFNQLYRPLFPEPDVLLTETQKLPGLDGRKMSKSYGNAVFLSDPPEEIDQKLSRMMTDPARVRRTDPGEPEKCPAFQLHKIYCTPEEIEYVTKGCRTATIGCLECKKIMIKHVIEDLAPIREKRRALKTSRRRWKISWPRATTRLKTSEPRPWLQCARRWDCEHKRSIGDLRGAAGPLASSDQEERGQHHRHSHRYHHRTISSPRWS